MTRRAAFLLVALSAAALLLASAHGSHAFYSAGDGVVELTPENFKQEVLSSKSVWFVEFYAPWCGHCKNLVPTWKKVAGAFDGMVKFGAVDADKHKGLGGEYGVQGFPTIKVFGADKKSAADYSGGRSADEITEAAMKEVLAVANARLGKKGAAGAGAGGGDADALVELTNDALDKDVMGGSDPWLLEFYAPWCGHCKKLAPEYKKAASLLKADGVKVGAVDATKHNKLNSKFKVEGFPTIVYLPKGGKESHVEYDGGRTADAIAKWVRGKIGK